MMLIGGNDQTVADWAGQAMGVKFVQPLAAFGIVEDDGLLKGAAIFNDYQGAGANIELTYIGPGTLTRKIMRGLAEFAFRTCNASRVTLKTMRRNLPVRKLLTKDRLGLRFEGTLKRYYTTEKEGDALMFVLYREDAPHWMMGG